MLREEVISRLREARIRPSRELSQHYLVDDAILGEIIRACSPLFDGTIVEVGAGIGTLTEALAKRAKKVIAYEPDTASARFLRKNVLPRFKNLEIRERFIHRYELDALLKEFSGEGLSFATNLPYQITSEFLLWVIAHAKELKGVVVMLQSEVAKRLNANPGSKAYGALSVYAQTFVYVTELVFVPRTCFYPVPQVDSTLVRINALSGAPKISDWNRYFKVVEALFRYRRRMILNALLTSFSHLEKTKLLKILARLDILPDRRGDTLSRDEFMALTDALFPPSSGRNKAKDSHKIQPASEE